jgi:hypothetical protein
MKRDCNLTEFSGPDGYLALCLCDGGELVCASCGAPFEDVRATSSVCLNCNLAVHTSSCIRPIGVCFNCLDAEL